MTDDELNELERLANAATEGPWMWTGGRDGDAYDGLYAPNTWVMEYAGCGSHEIACGEVDAKFIAAARDAVPKLIAEVRRLRSERDHDSPDGTCCDPDCARCFGEVKPRRGLRELKGDGNG